MSAPKGQSRTGTPFTSGGNSSKNSGGSIPQGQSKVGTDFIRGGKGNGTAGNSSGRIEGQKLRGYVHRASASGLPTPQDVTVNPDGSSRVKKL